MLKDYDMSVLHNLSKDNVVADALSPMTMGGMSHVEKSKKELVKYVHRFALLVVRFEDYPNGASMVHHNPESPLVVEVKSKKHLFNH